MSAYLVHPDHIDLLVTAGLARPIPHGCNMYSAVSDGANRNEHAELTVERATELGLMFWNENVKSIFHRYPDTIGKPDRCHVADQPTLVLSSIQSVPHRP